MIRSLACLAAFAAAALVGSASAEAQYVTYYSYSAPVVAAPTVVYRPVAPTVVYRPAAPVVTPVAYAAPATYTVARPVVARTPVVTTRWRPLLGGTVTRVRYRYAPVGYYAY